MSKTVWKIPRNLLLPSVLVNFRRRNVDVDIASTKQAFFVLCGRQTWHQAWCFWFILRRGRVKTAHTTRVHVSPGTWGKQLHIQGVRVHRHYTPSAPPLMMDISLATMLHGMTNVDVAIELYNWNWNLLPFFVIFNYVVNTITRCWWCAWWNIESLVSLLNNSPQD
jgi:hypothetical protein